jgi:hypothetical protein
LLTTIFKTIMVLTVNSNQRARFVRNLGIDENSLPFVLFPKQALIQSVSNLLTESVAGFDIPVINDFTPSEKLLFTAIDLKARPLYIEYQEVNEELAEALSLVVTADGSPLVPDGIEPIKFITPDSDFVQSEIYTQITKSQSYKRFKRDNRELFDDQDSVYTKLIILDLTMGRAKVALFLSTRIDTTWFDRANELTVEQIKEIVQFIQKEGNGGKVSEDEPTEETETKGEVVTEKNDSKVKSKDGQVTTGN